MLKTIEAIVERDGRVRLLEHVQFTKARRALVTFLEDDAGDEAALLSEAALGEDWNRDEEEAAWEHLQDR